MAKSLSVPELLLASGIARGINPCLAPGEIMDPPVILYIN